jgi:hypothetical protein
MADFFITMNDFFVTCIHTCIHTYIHIYIHIYMHMYIHSYIHTYIHTYIHMAGFFVTMMMGLFFSSFLKLFYHERYKHSHNFNTYTHNIVTRFYHNATGTAIN